MSSELKIRANRSNARLSTGPRTTMGKRVSAMNALRHGLTSKQILLPDERQSDLDAFRDEMLEDLKPEGALENVFAEKVVFDAWRLKRIGVFESALFARNIREEIFQNTKVEVDAIFEAVKRTDPKLLVAPPLEGESPRTTLENFLQIERPGITLSDISQQQSNSEAASVPADACLSGNATSSLPSESTEKKPQTYFEWLAERLGFFRGLQDQTRANPEELFVGETRAIEKYLPTFVHLEQREAALMRSLLKSLGELQRLQATRRERRDRLSISPTPA